MNNSSSSSSSYLHLPHIPRKFPIPLPSNCVEAAASCDAQASKPSEQLDANYESWKLYHKHNIISYDAAAAAAATTTTTKSFQKLDVKSMQ